MLLMHIVFIHDYVKCQVKPRRVPFWENKTLTKNSLTPNCHKPSKSHIQIVSYRPPTAVLRRRLWSKSCRSLDCWSSSHLIWTEHCSSIQACSSIPTVGWMIFGGFHNGDITTMRIQLEIVEL